MLRAALGSITPCYYTEAMTSDVAGACVIFWYPPCSVWSKVFASNLFQLSRLPSPVSQRCPFHFLSSPVIPLRSPPPLPLSLSLSWFCVTGRPLWPAIRHIAYSHPCRIHTCEQRDVCRTACCHWPISFAQAAFLFLRVNQGCLKKNIYIFFFVCVLMHWEYSRESRSGESNGKKTTTRDFHCQEL